MRKNRISAAVKRVGVMLAAAVCLLAALSVNTCIIRANSASGDEKVRITDTNPETGNRLIIDDRAGYFSDQEIRSLHSLMEEITAFCNVAVVTTTDHSHYSTEDFAGAYFDECFGPHTSGTLFVIDRCLNEIFLYSDGAARRTITDSKAYSITDNTYRYATGAHNYDYYSCSYKTMEQVLALMKGRRIAEPMKYICSALLAVIVALIANYIILICVSRQKKANIQQVLTGTYTKFQVHNANARFTHQTRVYSPPSSSSGGGHSGGGHSGGGHSGGGGGHRI